MKAWPAVIAGLALLGPGISGGHAAGTAPASVGEAIYLRGVLASGAPLEGVRLPGGMRTQGTGIACVNCHRRSGLGSLEGNFTIPPVAGPYLFRGHDAGRDEADLPYVESVRGNRRPYTDATLAEAIRSGIDANGKPLGYLMPRFDLDDADMAALIAYLKTLDPRRVRGVTDTVLHFATVITPDADPVKRRGVLDVLEQFVADKNAFPIGPSPHMRSSGKTTYSKTMYMANRRWQLHVWELTGPAAGWRAQLEQHLAGEPVMAVVSGLGGSNWAPVHDFCEQARVPCLFPNVEVPAEGEHDFYSVYLSKGVLLEAELIAKALGAQGEPHPVKELLQVYRAGDSGEAAAQVLAAELKRRGVVVRQAVLGAGEEGRGLGAALRSAGQADVLVLWLRRDDIAALAEVPPKTATVFMSGLMGGLERSPVPAAWRSRVQLAYPFDLPDRRVVRVDYPLGWFSFRHIPVVDEQVQADTYLACGLLAETLSHMADTFVPEYLVERLRDSIDHRIITGYYPHLNLAIGQQFASKGGYIVRFAGSEGTRLVADSSWLVP